jgi:hypothetical protein
MSTHENPRRPSPSTSEAPIYETYDQVDDLNERAVAEVGRLFSVEAIAPQIEEHEDRAQQAMDIVDVADRWSGPLPPSKVPFKYYEQELLAELHDYLAGTYGKHYVGDDNVQAMDLIASAHHAEGFCIGSIIKYASRYGKKGGRNRADLLKIVHYALFALWDKDKRGL